MKIITICQIIAILLSCALFAAPAAAKTWHVPGDAATIKGGINLASTGDTVLVACGTYYEHDIRMKSGVCLRSETGNASCVTIDAQQQDRVIYCRFVTNTARIEGFTITGGVASEGGGLWCLDNSSPLVKNCVITGDSASDYGGGVRCDVNSSPTFLGCTISGNSAGNGGGISCHDNSDPTLTDCVLSDNVGGGLECYHFCSLTLTNCALSNNWAPVGGGIHVSRRSTITLAGCTFSGNTGDWRGGGMSLAFDASASLSNCTFTNNSTGGTGAGMYIAPTTSATLSNCSFAGNSGRRGTGIALDDVTITLTSCSFTGNTADSDGTILACGASHLIADATQFENNSAGSGAGISLHNNASATLTNCTFADNSAESGGGGMFVRDDATATLTDCSFADNSAQLYGGGIALEGTSVTLNGCSLTGNYAYEGGGICLYYTSQLAADTTAFENNTCRRMNAGAHGYVTSGSEAVLTCCVPDLSGFTGDGIITLNNEGCLTPTEPTTWGRVKAMYAE
ncbi:MAG: right-handed parallel beta-helix repeat-containing protein [Candidatus Latescibacterota bacterium]|nr:MAG: right-handed parallel beta-helix repeat-containing protein [Candidatus Latescibacterota bacterium]